MRSYAGMPAPLHIQIARRVRQVRLQRGLSQEQLAEQLDLSAATVGRIELGKVPMTLETLVHVSEALSTPLGSLLEERTDGLTEAEADVLQRWRKLDDRGRTAFRALLHVVTDARGSSERG